MISHAPGRRRPIKRQPHEVFGRRLFEPKTRIVLEAKALVITRITENDASLGVGFREASKTFADQLPADAFLLSAGSYRHWAEAIPTPVLAVDGDR
jgi:hypothetical protein